MPTLTLKSVPAELMDRLRESADGDRRSINQQAIFILESALGRHRPRAFGEFLESFYRDWGAGDLTDADFDGLRPDNPMRSADLGE